jgi:hypothetical protein
MVAARKDAARPESNVRSNTICNMNTYDYIFHYIILTTQFKAREVWIFRSKDRDDLIAHLTPAK